MYVISRRSIRVDILHEQTSVDRKFVTFSYKIERTLRKV